MKIVLRAKFSRPDLKERLIETGNKTLVELNEFDTFFGAGISLKNTAFSDRKVWKGQNVLGFLLMNLRSELSEQGEGQTVPKTLVI